MPDAATETTSAAASAISASDAIGWAVKAGTFAYSIWKGHQDAEQRKKDMALLGRYHDIEMAKLNQMAGDISLGNARSAVQTAFDGISQNYENLLDIDTDQVSGEKSDDFYNAVTEFANGLQNRLPDNLLKDYRDALMGDVAPGGKSILDSYCEVIKSATLNSSEVAIGSLYWEWELTQYRKGLACWGMYKQVRTVCPHVAVANLTIADVRNADWDAALSEQQLKDMVKEEYGTSITEIAKHGAEVIADKLGTRYDPKAGSRTTPGKFFGWDKRRNEANEQELKCRALGGWLHADWSKDGEQTAIVGFSLVKAKADTDMPFAKTTHGVSLQIHYAAVDDILADKLDAVRTKRIEDADGGVDVEDIIYLGDGATTFLANSPIRATSSEEGKLAVVTGARLFESERGEVAGIAMTKALALELEYRLLDLEAKTLSEQTYRHQQSDDAELYNLFTHTKTEQETSGTGPNMVFTDMHVWDGTPEAFALAECVPNPLSFVYGAILHHDDGKRNTEVSAYPLSILNL